MKKIIIVAAAFCSISIYAQENGGADDILMEAKKDYLYHLAQLNTAYYGNRYRTELRFVDNGGSRDTVGIREMLQRVPAFQKMKIKWQIKQADFFAFDIRLHIEESRPCFITQADGTRIECVDTSNIDTQYKYNIKYMEAVVFFVLLKNTNGFTKKSGEGEIIPSKLTTSYRWALKDNLLIFIYTYAPPKEKIQQYVYLPKVE